MFKDAMDFIAKKITYEATRTSAGYAVTAAITKEGFLDFMKFYAFGAYVMRHQSYTSEMEAKFKKWGEGAKEFAKEFKVSPKLIDKAINALPKGKFTEDKAAKLWDDLWVLREIGHGQKAKIKGTKGITPQWLSLLGALNQYYNGSSIESEDNAYKRIEQMISQLGEPSLTGLMNQTVDEEADPTHIHNFYAFIRKHLKDPKAQRLPTGHRETMSDAVRKKYDDLKKKESNATKSLRRQIVRQSGQHLMPIETFRQKMAEHGVDTWYIPKGFNGKIDEDGKYYTKDGHQLNGLPLGGKVEMNKDWHPVKNPSVWVARGVSPFSKTGEATPYYTVHHTNTLREDKKGEALENMQKLLPSMQSKWRKDLKGKGQNKTLAMMTECLYYTACRPGSNENAKSSGADTYGLSTWLAGMVRPQANGTVKIVYRPGKSKASEKNTNEKTNFNITHVIRPDTPESAMLIEYLKKAIANKKPKDKLWTADNKVVNYGQLSAYIKELSDGTVSPKNFRTFRGTKMFLEMLAARPPKKKITEKELKAYHDKLSLKVGEMLGHVKTNAEGQREATPRMAQTAYINPHAQISLYRERGYQPPSHILKFEKKDED